jgi:hypothetical protein
MAADGNTAGSPPPVNVYQMSDAVGRGFALAADFLVGRDQS